MKKMFFAAMLLATTGLSAAETVSKEGGVAFRFDDNKSADQWSRMAQVFEKHGFVMNVAVVTGQLTDPAAIEVLRGFKTAGHDIMDHTPFHLGFIVKSPDAAKYAKEPFVDHIAGNNICLKYIVRPDAACGRFTADVSENATIKPGNEAAAKLLQREWLLYLPASGRVLTGWAVKDQPGVFRLTTIWHDAVADFYGQKNLEFVILNNWRGERAGVILDPRALDFLVKFSREALQQKGLPAPTVWIQPGTTEPLMRGEDIAAVFRANGLVSAATYPNSAFKTYCEPNPEHCRYGMQWGNFNLEDDTDLKVIKKKIADDVARHHFIIGSGHMWTTKVTDGFDGYLARHDQLLKWLRESGIKVDTQRAWADRLYGTKTNPAENIFPPFNVDRDGDGIPDGITPGPGTKVSPEGIELAQKGLIFRLGYLGGVEKGMNRLTYKGAKGKLKTVIRFIRRGGVFGEAVEFTGNNHRFEVPKDAAMVTVELFNDSDEPASVAGAELRADTAK